MDDVRVVPYNHRWPRLFGLEVTRLRKVLGTQPVLAIEHFGSTAVPGLAAKPIIDILIAVPSLARAKATMIEPILGLGYVYWAENPKMDRMFFVKGMPPYGLRRTHHIHITEPEGEMWQRRLAFRDYLRTHPEEARRYEALKLDLAARYPEDLEAYTDAKSDYIERVHAMMRRAQSVASDAPARTCQQ